MEAKMESLSVSSSQEDWESLFRKCPEAREIILGRIDLESALACRLVCKEWRVAVNYYKKLWAKINEVNIRQAVSVGNVLLTELLIAKAGGEVNTQYEDGVTLLHLTSAHGHVEVVNILIQAGGEVNSQTKGSNFNGRYLAVGSTPLHVASLFGHVEVVKSLIQAGGDVNKKGEYGDTPLHYASVGMVIGRKNFPRLHM